jgi:hypothetical protein
MKELTVYRPAEAVNVVVLGKSSPMTKMKR